MKQVYYSSLGKHSKKDLNAFNKSLRRYLTKYKNTTIYNFIHEKVLFIPININLFSIYKDIYYLIIIFFCIRITIKRKDIPINSKFNYSIYASRKLYKNSIINKEDIYYKLTFDKNISSTENIIGKRLKNDIYEFEEITKQDIL